MTPVAHGWEQDYYRASRACRAAWEARDDQLTIAALEEEETGREERAGVPTAAALGSSSSSAPVDSFSPRTGGALVPLSTEAGVAPSPEEHRATPAGEDGPR